MRYFYALIAFMMLSTSAIAANPQVIVDTNRGSFVLELYPEKAPKTVANFMEYAQSGFYNGTIFHRVINRFMIQGGGLDKNLNENRPEEIYKNIDTSKQVIIKAGSMHLDDFKVSSRSKSKLRNSSRNIISKISEVLMNSHINKSKRKRNIENNSNLVAKNNKSSAFESSAIESRNKSSKISIISNAIAKLRNTSEKSKWLGTFIWII